MGRGLAGEPGGISGLLSLLDEHQEAVEYDLIQMGLRLDHLGSEALSWRDLLVIVHEHAHRSRTALYRSQHPDEWMWDLREQLDAAMVDELRAANWQRGGGKGRQPKPIPRPGIEPDSKQYGSDPIPMEEMAEWLGWSVN